MAKITTLTERGTDEYIFPQTVAKAVMMSDGRDMETAVDDAKMALLIDAWRLAWGADGSYDPTKDEPFIGNGVGMTAQEAIVVLMRGHVFGQATSFYTKFDARTNLPRIGTGYTIEYRETFKDNTRIEVAHCATATVGLNCFANCTNLRIVTGQPYCINGTPDGHQFKGCVNLEEVYGTIRGTYSLDMSDCPKLTQGCIARWVASALNTEPITITLHADVYDALPDDVIVAAGEKQITFASL